MIPGRTSRTKDTTRLGVKFGFVAQTHSSSVLNGARPGKRQESIQANLQPEVAIGRIPSQLISAVTVPEPGTTRTRGEAK